MVPLVANGTIGNQRTLNVSQSFIGANVTIGGNVGTNGTFGSHNGTIGKPKGVNSNIMINTSNLFFILIFHVYISVFILIANSILIKQGLFVKNLN